MARAMGGSLRELRSAIRGAMAKIGRGANANPLVGTLQVTRILEAHGINVSRARSSAEQVGGAQYEQEYATQYNQAIREDNLKRQEAHNKYLAA